VRGTDCHPTAEWVYDEVKKQLPGISLGTVYRNLKLLCRSGEVFACEGAGGMSRYDGCTTTHHHFRCEACGTMIDIDEQVDSRLDERVAASTGLRIRCHVLEFRGLCRDCELIEPPPARQNLDA
jgi:Fur family transcriptional regulator, peroxide stress response regulator